MSWELIIFLASFALALLMGHCYIVFRKALHRHAILPFSADGWDYNMHTFKAWWTLPKKSRTIIVFLGAFGFTFVMPVLIVEILFVLVWIFYDFSVHRAS